MVGLPTVESRESILRTLLSKEKVEKGLNYQELAMMTEGYSGSDLKVCFSFLLVSSFPFKCYMSSNKLANDDYRTYAQRQPTDL